MTVAFNSGFREDFGQVLKNQREEVGLSQRQFANFLNISPQVLSDYESNKAKPSKEILKKISMFFTVDEDYYARIPKL